MHIPQWNLRLLGAFDLTDGERVVDSFGERRDEELLAFLALSSPTLVSRDTIAGNIWPHAKSSPARQNLSFYLFHLKKRLMEPGIEEPIEEVRKRLRLHPSISVDAARFTGLLAEAAHASSPSERIWRLDQAIRLFGAGLLPGIDFTWLRPHQDQFESLYQNAALELARLTQGDSPMRKVMLHLPAVAWQSQTGAATAAPSADVSADPSKPAAPVNAEDVLALVAEASAALGGADAAAALDLLAQHEPEVLATAEQLAEAGRKADALQMLTSIWRYWHRRKAPEAGYQAIGRLLASPGDVPDKVRAGAQSAAGNLAASTGRHAQALELLGQAQAYWQTGDASHELICSHANLGRVHHMMGDYPAAREQFDRGLALARELQDKPARLELLRSAALTEIRLSDAPQAEQLLRERLALLKSGEGNPVAEADTLAHLASVHLLKGEHELAARTTGEARARFDETGNLEGVALCLMLLGRVAYIRGDLELSRAKLEEALAVARQSGGAWQIGLALSYLGVVQEVIGDEAAQLTQWDAISVLTSAGGAGEVAAIQRELAEFRAWSQGVSASARPAG